MKNMVFPPINEREQALQTLSQLEVISQISGSQEDLRKIVAFLKHEHREVRYTAAEILGKLGERVKPYIPSIIELLTDTDRYIHFAGIEALSCLKEIAIDAAPQLVALLDHPAWDVRYDVIEVLAEIRAEACIPQIVERLEDHDSRVRFAAVEALGQLGEVTSMYIPQIAARRIAHHLEDEDPMVRSLAAQVLENLGNVAKAYIPQISERLGDSDPIVRAAAVVALGYLGKEAKKNGHICQLALQQIAVLFTDREPAVRSTALKIVGEMGEDTKMYIPLSIADQIADSLQDHEPQVRAAAVEAMGKLGYMNHAYIPQVAACLNDSDSLVRASTLIALGNLECFIHDYVPHIRACLTDQEPMVSSAAQEVLNILYESMR
ncbi:heat domain containing protein [Candidatus Vecturithrix granuli]|uniref:Heat domain containing protein n=1 Tax=Vecturithrix granuli TaxID=1499967 RepID=A0A081C5V0_VECG1|nr:heat domain containing protein [Candidatus Vecturithrix granuli]